MRRIIVFDVVVPNDRCQLLRVIHSVQLRTADEGNLAFHEILVHVGIGVGRAVGRDQQFCAVKKGRLRGKKLKLARPLIEPRNRFDGLYVRLNRFLFPAKLHHSRAGAAALTVVFTLPIFRLLQRLRSLYSRFIIG